MNRKDERCKLSICMIVRDEEKFLDRCLRSLKPLIDLNIAELIVVDTGSIDNTVEIAKKYTKYVYFKEWNNSFSEARNYSISFAKGEYIFIMDADQEMEYSEIKKLIKLFSSNNYKKFNTYSLVYKNFTNEELSEYTYFSLNLIFKNDGYFKYEGKIHNQPLYKSPVKNLEIYMLHYGYIMTEDMKEKKFRRTATLLKEEIENDPENIYYIYQLSRSYEMHNDTKEAVIELEKYLSLMKTKKVNDSFKINYYHNASIIYFNAKKYDNCIYYCEKMKKLDCELIDCYYLMGKCNFIEGDVDESVKNFNLYLKYLKKFKYEKYASTNGLEVFSYGHRYRVVSEFLRLKIKINQLENIDKYILYLSKDMDSFMMLLGEILKSYIILQNIDSLDNIIKKVKEKDQNILLLYLLSKAICESNCSNKNLIISNLNSINDNEKELLTQKVNKEEQSSFLNLTDFINENKKQNNKVIKVENCVTSLIDTLNQVSVEEIIDSKFRDDMIHIIKYLLSKSDMLINAYLVNSYKIMKLLSKYELVIKNLNEDRFIEDKKFIDKLEQFRNHINNREIVKAILNLKDAIEIKNEFCNLVSFIKSSMVLQECIEYNSLISLDELDKIKKNLIVLINNNMFIEAIELFEQLEELYNIKEDVELISIKVTLKFYNSEICEAKEILKEGLKYYPTNIDLLYNLAYIYETENKYLSAMNTYYNILDVDLENLHFDKINSNLERINKLVPII